MPLSTELAKYFADREPPYINLSATSFFDDLTDDEKLYAHYMLKASYAGSRVVLRQVSHESEAIFDMVLTIHSNLQGKYPEGEESTFYLEYVSQFLANMGNFNSFGNSKFIPRCSKEFFLQLLESAQIDKSCKPSTQSCLFETYEELIEKGIYYVDPNLVLLGFPAEGHTSAYYFGNVSQEDMTMLHKEVFGAYDLMPENVRIRKFDDKNFEILVASEANDVAKGYPTSSLQTSCGATVTFKFGDHSSEMKAISDYLEKASEYAANDTQRDMIAAYVDHFRTGDMKAHKESQKLWVKDLSPIIETNIGFVETYREPSGIIGEYESLVAVTNKERTKKFTALVENAEKYISLLPWGPEFEKPVFTPPDFTSLEVLTFVGSGIPAGINIPNYDDVRTNVGFKNVSLGNILNASISTIKPSFVWEEDADLFNKYQSEAFEVQVGIHELLGHGSGLLLSELPDGTFNFPIDNPPLGVDNKPVTTYYKKGETWSSKFGQLSGPYEECRAEVIAMYLITNRELLSLFGFTDKATQDMIIYIGYLQMARAGLLALEYWDPNTEKWGQPHMQARFAIMKTFLEYVSDESFLQFVYTEDDFSDLTIKLDRNLIETVGRDSLTDFLRHLHIYKSSGDVDRGTEYFLERTSVPPHLSRFRDIILKKKQPRRQFVQPNTFIDEHGAVILHEYEASALGVLKSFAEREL